ncbi:MAG TPA: alkaline phytoceramidase [Candidatus Angelobacter sp.]|nr:alkaline phytoceramidase [Candidatus Angelobacter sp.]
MLKGLRALKPATRWLIITAVCLAAAAVVAMLKPIAQPQSYHDFADQRAIFGIAHGMDVLSNAAFLISGLLGLWFVLRAGITLDAGTRWAFAILFFGLVLTSAGSAFYHLDPDNQRLVFDRMPMIIAMAGCVGAVVADRFGGASAWSITALLAIGLWTVHQWNVSEELGQGDLRWYALYQGLIILVGVLLLVLFPSRNGATPAFVIAVVGNIAAKIFELLDKPIFALGGIVSGHTLKHLSAGLAFLPLALLIRRIGNQRMVDDSQRPDLIPAGSGH